MRKLAFTIMVAAFGVTSSVLAVEQLPIPLTIPIHGSVEVAEAEALKNCDVQYTQAEWRNPDTGTPVISDFCASGTTMTSYVVDFADGRFAYFKPPTPIEVEDTSEE